MFCQFWHSNGNDCGGISATDFLYLRLALPRWVCNARDENNRLFRGSIGDRSSQKKVNIQNLQSN
jgi:hypothetical protein